MASEIIAGCWIEVYELPQFCGQRRRLFGPASHQALRCSDERWGIPINSIIVGPDAHVRLYESLGTERGWTLMPGEHIGDLKSIGITDAVDSLTIFLTISEYLL